MKQLPTWREMHRDTTPEVEAIQFAFYRSAPDVEEIGNRCPTQSNGAHTGIERSARATPRRHTPGITTPFGRYAAWTRIAELLTARLDPKVQAGNG